MINPKKELAKRNLIKRREEKIKKKRKKKKGCGCR
jgi:hypothetical protein